MISQKMKRIAKLVLFSKRENSDSERPSSYPFISGDTFRSMADFIIETKTNLDEWASLTKKLGEKNQRRIVFISVSFLETLAMRQHLLAILKDNYPLNSRSILILHNGDKIPSHDFCIEIGAFFDTVFAVNITKQFSNIRPLPIGLENLHYFNNGRLRDFTYIKNKSSYNFFPKKSDMIFSAFNITTNPSVRKKVYEDVVSSRFDSHKSKLSPEEYRSKVMSSYYTISPPGNGPDCHRTWEAIYLKCVPVVLEGYLSTDFTDSCPIVVTKDYSTFLAKSDQDLIELYHKTSSRITNKIYAPYWQRLFEDI
jgi:hypothetical protein